LVVSNLRPGQRVRCPSCDHSWAAVLPKAVAKKVVVIDAEEVEVTARKVDDRPRRTKKRADLPPPRPSVPGWAIGLIVGVLALVLVGGGVIGWLLVRPRPAAPVADATKPTEAPPAPKPEPAPNRVGAPAITRLPVATNLSREQLYLRTLKGTVFLAVKETRPGSPAAYPAVGTGVLVHLDKRWVVTSYQLAAAGNTVLVYFPERGNTGTLVTDPRYYLDNSKTLAIAGRVIDRNPAADLALVELDKLGTGAEALPLANQPPDTGNELMWIGSAGFNPTTLTGTLWRQSSATVRDRSKQVMQTTGMQIAATVVETAAELNGIGDRGGPSVNEIGEVAGIASYVPPPKPGAEPLRCHIDASEVKTFLEGAAARAGWSWTDTLPTIGAGQSADQMEMLLNVVRTGSPVSKATALRRLADYKTAVRPHVPELIPLLDDLDAGVKAAAAAALAKIGPPPVEHLGCLDKALTDPGPGGRTYALRMYGSELKLPAAYLTKVIGWLESADPETKALAAGALGHHGPDCRGVALDPLAKAATDSRPTVADAAAEALGKLGPYRGPDFNWLTDRATDPNPALRRFAVARLGVDAERVETAVSLLAPALSDSDAKVRAAAADGIARWGKAAVAGMKTEPLLKLLADADPDAQAAAARAAGRLELQPAFATLRDLMKTGSTPAVKQAAAEALPSLDLSHPTDGAVAVDVLFACEFPAAQAKLLDKLAATGALTAARLPKAGRCLASADAGLRTAALKALAAVGPAAAGQADAVAKLLADPDEATAEQAIDTLVRLGPAAADSLVRALDDKLTPAAKGRVCRAIGKYGTDAPKVAVVYLIGAAEKDAALRDAVADGLVSLNTDEVSTEVRKCVVWSSADAKRKTGAFPIEFQLWAFKVLAKLDPKKLSDKERASLLSALKNQSENDPDQRRRKEARDTFVKLESAAKAK
jgi:HEAT repeat protein